MSKPIDSNVDDLTKILLRKCEVSSLKDFYLKWLTEHDHVVPIKEIANFHENFNLKKIKADVFPIETVLIISLYDYFRTSSGDKQLSKELYLVDKVGLGRILRSLRRKHFFEKRTPLITMGKKLGILPNTGELPSNDENLAQLVKLKTILQSANKDGLIYCRLITPQSNFSTMIKPSQSESNELELAIKEGKIFVEFYSKFSLPQHRNTLISLIITIIAIVVSLAVFLPILYTVNL